MQIVEVKKREVNLKALRTVRAKDSDVTHSAQENTILTIDGKPVVAYLSVKNVDGFSELRSAVKALNYSTGDRTLGMISTSAIFGFRVRNAVRSDFCSAAAAATKCPKAHETVCGFITKVIDRYRDIFPDEYALHESEANERFLPDYKIKGTPFTSGIANKSSALAYHFDTGNIKSGLSCMIGLRSGTAGGSLVIPELDYRLPIADGTLTIFNGQKILHGVSPIIKMRPDGYRYTIVYYSLLQIWKCLPPSEELKRANQIRAMREKRRITGEVADELRRAAKEKIKRAKEKAIAAADGREFKMRSRLGKKKKYVKATGKKNIH